MRDRGRDGTMGAELQEGDHDAGAAGNRGNDYRIEPAFTAARYGSLRPRSSVQWFHSRFS